MFKIVTKRDFNQFDLKDRELQFPDLIIQGLKSIGFKEIEKNENTITFRSYLKDPNVESFQRRYGNGKILFEEKNGIKTISTIYENKFDIIFNFLSSIVVLIVMNHYLIKDLSLKIELILSINLGFLIINIIGFLIKNTRYKFKQREFLNLLEKKMTEQ